MVPADGLLVAAGLDWLEGLLPFLFVLIWIISQVMNLFRGAAKPPAAAPRAPVRRPPPPPVDGGAPAREDEPLADEIREFLRVTLEGQRRQPPAKPQVPPSRPRQRTRRPGSPAVAASGRPASLPAARDNVAGHVATAFAHDLAHQSPDRMGVAPSRESEPSAAGELLAALRGPGGLRQLILMREVLERPTHRW